MERKLPEQLYLPEVQPSFLSEVLKEPSIRALLEQEMCAMHLDSLRKLGVAEMDVRRQVQKLRSTPLTRKALETTLDNVWKCRRVVTSMNSSVEFSSSKE